MEVYDNDGNIQTSNFEVLEKWQHDFSDLYKGPSKEFDLEFYNTCMIDKMVYEETLKDPIYVNQAKLNECISQKELENALSRCKNKKATGTDKIPNEVLKNKNSLSRVQCHAKSDR